jgi:predicted N-formylglutamate amidohydrolase
MAAAAQLIEGDRASKLLIVADHASAAVPDGIDLGVPAWLLADHVAIDIGVAPLAAALCDRLGCPAILGGVSRLVIDLNREEDAAGLVPVESDGHRIDGNASLSQPERAQRIARFWRPYHLLLAERIAADQPRLIVSLHSFTPSLASRPTEVRPWQVGVLWNNDERAARIALPLLSAAGVVAGDNQPYSGKLLNATMNRHAEGTGTAYLGLEVRQDLIGDADGVARWAAILAPLIGATRDALA